MARFFRYVVAIACLLAGAMVGALNPQPVVLDLGIATLHAGLGLSVLVALLVGVLVVGGSVVIGVVLPLRRRLPRETAGLAAATDTGD